MTGSPARMDGGCRSNVRFVNGDLKTDSRRHVEVENVFLHGLLDFGVVEPVAANQGGQ